MDAPASINSSPTRALTSTASDHRQVLIEPEALPPSKGGASLSTVLFSLLATILGAGILGLPYAYSKSGMVGGCLLLLVCCCLSAFGAHLLVEASDRSGRPASFYSVAQAIGGARAGVAMDLLIFVNSYGSATSYLIVVGGVMPDVAESFGASGFVASRQLWMLVALAVAAPLSYLRDLSALRFAAYVTFVMTVYITAVVVLFAVMPGTFDPCAGTPHHSPSHPLDCRDELVLTVTDPMDMLGSLPIYIFAFTNHQNAITATNEMDRPTRARALKAILGAVGLGLGLYLCVGGGGYYTFGPEVASDVLAGEPGKLSYPDKAALVIVGRIAIAIVVTMCYPLQVHPGRGCLISLLLKAAPASWAKRDGAGSGNTLHVVATSLMVAGTIGTALAVKSLGVILTLIGAVCSTSVQFILPGAAYFLLFTEPGRRKRWFALGQLILGLIIVPLCLTLTFIGM